MSEKGDVLISEKYKSQRWKHIFFRENEKREQHRFIEHQEL